MSDASLELIIEAQYLEHVGFKKQRGIGRYITNLATALADRPDTNVTIAVPGFRDLDEEYLDVFQKYGIKMVTMGHLHTNNPTAYSRWLDSLQGDALVIGSPAPLFSLENWMVIHPSLINKRVASIAYDVIPLLFQEDYIKAIPHARELATLCSTFEESDVILSISDATKSDLLKSVNPKLSVEVIGASADVLEGESLSKPNISTPPSDKMILYVGGTDKRKNPQAAIPATIRASEIIGEPLHLVFVGPEATAGKAPKTSTIRISHSGYVSDAELNDLYKNCSALIFPSLYEGAGLPILEAYRYGKPVAAFNNSAIPEYSCELEYLAPSGNADALGERLAQAILEDSGDRISKRIHKSKFHSWEKVASKTLAALIAAPNSTKHLSCNIIGYLDSPLGLGYVGRTISAAYQQKGISTHPTSFNWIVQYQGDAKKVKVQGSQVGPVSIYCLNPDAVAVAWGTTLVDEQEDGYRICIPFYELTKIPRKWKPILQCMDELWVASDFLADLFATEFDGPVRRIHLPLPQIPAHADKENADLFTGNAFRFGMVFDGLSTIERKNPLKTIEAFQAAFRENEDVELHIKSRYMEHYPPSLRRLKRLVATDPRITLHDEHWPEERLHAFFKELDCYISLHRSEGLGLTMAEAMSCGTPTIATGYSGNLAFMTPENSFLIPYELIPAKRRHYHQAPKGAMWAEADTDAAAEAMRTVFEGGPEVDAKVKRAQADVAAFSTERFASEIQGYLQIATHSNPVRPPLPRAVRKQMRKTRSAAERISDILPPNIRKALSQSRLANAAYRILQ